LASRLSDKTGLSQPTLFRTHRRDLSADDVAKIAKVAKASLGLTISSREIAYMSWVINGVEDRGLGRIAAHADSLVVRALAALALGRSQLQVAEIGTLYGLGAIGVARAIESRGVESAWTLVDPLDGYYLNGKDPVIGVPVAEKTLRGNLEAFDLESRWQVRVGMSNDPDILNQVIDGSLDMVVVDGDHTAFGVTSDFQCWWPKLRVGGIMLFDDYGNSDWPEVERAANAVLAGRRDVVVVWEGNLTLAVRRLSAEGEHLLLNES